MRLSATGTRVILILAILMVSVALLAASLYLPRASPPVLTARGVFYVEDGHPFIGRNPLSMNVDFGSLNDGDTITLGNVTFKFRRPPTKTTTVVNLTTTTVTSTVQIDYICPEYFMVTFSDGTSVMLDSCTPVGKVGFPRSQSWQMYQLTDHEDPRVGLLVKGEETRLVKIEVTLLVSGGQPAANP